MKLLIAMLAGLVLSTSAAAEYQDTSGNELLRKYRSVEALEADMWKQTDVINVGEFYGYTEGVRDTAAGVTVCTPDGVTRAQLGAVVGNYLKAHPEQLHLWRRDLVLAAMRKAFPCSK